MRQLLRLGSESEHSFSIELDTRDQLHGIDLPSGVDQRVLIEGQLGKLKSIQLVEALMLEIECTGGILRLDLTEAEYRDALKLKEP